MIRSDCPHGRITRFDVSAACELDGVAAILTGKDALADDLRNDPAQQCSDFEGVPLAVDGPDVRILPHETVRYVGEPIGLIVAEDLATAQAALDLIDVEYDALPFALSPMDEAAEPGYSLHHGDTAET